MFQFLRQLWHHLCARLRFCGGVQYLAGTASLPSPLSPAEEKALLARMAAGEADARTICGWWCTLPKSTRTAVCPPRT